MKRRIKLAVLGATVLVLVGLPVVTHYRAKGRAEAYRRQLKAEGEPTSFADLQPVLSTEEIRVGLELKAAGSQLRGAYSNAPAMKFIAPGRALAACREEVLPAEGSTNVWPGLELLVSQNQAALGQLRAAVAGSSGFGFNLDYNLGASMPLPHLSQMKSWVQWLFLSASIELHAGRITNAWEDLDALARIATGFRKDPVMISELVRIAIAAIAINATWEGLQCPGWNDEQLKLLQQQWQGLDFLSQAESALTGERLSVARTFETARRSFAAVRPGNTGSGFAEMAQVGKEIVNDPGEGFKSALHRYPGYWGWKYWQSYDDEIAHGEITQAAIDALRNARTAGIPALAVSNFEASAARLSLTHRSAFKWLDYSPGTLHAGFLTRIRTVEIQRALLISAIALKRYELKHGQYPADLSALVPEFVTQLPRDPMDGKPLRYRLNPDGTFLLYSIGENGVDDGGNPKPAPDAPRQWWRARDAVWPWPGTREEVQAEFQRAAAEYKNRGAADSLNAMEAFRRRYGLMPATNTPMR